MCCWRYPGSVLCYRPFQQFIFKMEKASPTVKIPKQAIDSPFGETWILVNYEWFFFRFSPHLKFHTQCFYEDLHFADSFLCPHIRTRSYQTFNPVFWSMPTNVSNHPIFQISYQQLSSVAHSYTFNQLQIQFNISSIIVKFNKLQFSEKVYLILYVSLWNSQHSTWTANSEKFREKNPARHWQGEDIYSTLCTHEGEDIYSTHCTHEGEDIHSTHSTHEGEDI